MIRITHGPDGSVVTEHEARPGDLTLDEIATLLYRRFEFEGGLRGVVSDSECVFDDQTPGVEACSPPGDLVDHGPDGGRHGDHLWDGHPEDKWGCGDTCAISKNWEGA